VVEHVTFNHVVVSSILTRLTNIRRLVSGLFLNPDYLSEFHRQNS